MFKKLFGSHVTYRLEDNYLDVFREIIDAREACACHGDHGSRENKMFFDAECWQYFTEAFGQLKSLERIESVCGDISWDFINTLIQYFDLLETDFKGTFVTVPFSQWCWINSYINRLESKVEPVQEQKNEATIHYLKKALVK